MEPKTKRALIITISEHNISQLYNCIDVNYDTVILLASKDYNHQRERFVKVLNTIKPNVSYLPADLPVDADDYEALSEFVENRLKDKIEGYQLDLNCTGGTKVIPIVLLDLLNIHHVFYKGMKHDYLQRWQPGNPLTYKDTPLANQVTAEQALSLYCDSIDFADHSLAPYSQSQDAVSLAECIWQQYELKDSAMSWFAKQLSLSPWLTSTTEQTFDFMIPLENQQNTVWQEWFERLAAFSQGQLTYQHPVIKMNTHKKKKHPANLFKRWLCGDWLEQLVQNWLYEVLPTNQLLCGVKTSTTGKQGANRELDFICFYKTAGYVIETKVTTAPNQTDNKMVQQIVSLAENFGKLEKILLLSPLFFQEKLDKHSQQQFEQYCASHKVRLCRNKNELLTLFPREKHN